MCDFKLVSNGLITNRIQQHQQLLIKMESDRAEYVYHIIRRNFVNLTVDWARESLYYVLRWSYNYNNGSFL